MNTYVEGSDWFEWDSSENYWFVIWDCGIYCEMNIYVAISDWCEWDPNWNYLFVM